ncbi:MAG TPA: NAD-dependent epimerase/dehydratase family protein [Candidatus Limnocylindrales bacterium]|nr:NAD-dependent epimerase/dehydratase family protein [Candidatus Limnocylindrales bacterium]
MKILVTGSSGFVGSWLVPELRGAGHEVAGMPEPDVLDIGDMAAVRDAVAAVRPDGVIHLAGMAYAPDATAAAAEAIRVNLGGTLSVLEACRAVVPGCSIVVVGSADVYRAPREGGTLIESSPLAPRGVYGLTKLAAEALAVAAAGTGGLRTAVVRSFNHTGPGQRPVFAVPAFAARILEARRMGLHEIRAGNVDVARDLSDVRDVVRAYRLLLEALVANRVRPDQRVFNVASGRVVTMRWVIGRLAELAGWAVSIEVDHTLVRADDPPEMRGDASALHSLTGWAPEIPFDETLRDLVTSLEAARP